jgi:integrase
MKRERSNLLLLTDSIVRGLPAPATGSRITYDGGDPSKRVAGFGARITAAGMRAFILNYRINGLERRYTIGSFPDWTVPQAREEAKRLKRDIDQGYDPLLEKREARAAPTVNDLIERWRTDQAPRNQPRTRAEYEGLIRGWIARELGNRKVADIRYTDIDRLHRKITATGAAVRANRTVTFLSRLFNLAIRWEMRTDNPASKIERNTEQPRQRYLAGAELDRLSAALAADRNQAAANAIRLLLLTGARSGEVFAATWRQFDIETGVWTKPAATTKTRREHRVPLSPAAQQLLIDMRDKAGASPYLFPARDRDGSIADIKSTWRRVCKAAQLDGLRPHDARHSFASILASAGLSLPVIGELLGHTQASTTKRYSHLFDDALRAATDRVGAIVTAAAKRAAGAQIIQLPKRKG